MNKVRIIITKDCHRACPNCCNTMPRIMEQFAPIHCLKRLVVPLDEIMLTGGDIMLNPKRTLRIIGQLRERYPDAKIYGYAGADINNNRDVIKSVLHKVDGMTFTLHYPLSNTGRANFSYVQKYFSEQIEFAGLNKSLILRVDKRIMDGVYIIPSVWSDIDVFEWIDDEEQLLNVCPKDEMWFEYTGE